jgi:hypothetical protein
VRFVVAKRMSRRGEGLGNELLPWAKGWIASQELDALLVGPAWGLNRRGYRRNFRTGRFDFVCEDLVLRLPNIEFTEADYRQTGEIDFGAAIRKWANDKDLKRRRSFIVRVDGMWGGYAAIHRARPFLWSKLLSSRDALRNVDHVLADLDRKKLFVAVHLRAGHGEFTKPAPGEDLRGRFNICVPAVWYLWVCEELKRAFHGRIQFWFFTDQPNADFDEAVRRFNPGQLALSSLTECSDLLLMALADVRICSVSSYSMAACFLADGPYIWYEPQLTLRNGLYSLWGSEDAQQLPCSPTLCSSEFLAGLSQDDPVAFAGSAIDTGDPLPSHLIELLAQQLIHKERRTNLLDYGCLPLSLLKGSRAPIGMASCCS